MAWRLEPGETLGDAFRRVAAEEIAKIRLGLGNEGADRAKAIHEARQGFKRLRALLRLGQPALGIAFNDENRLWRDAGRQLAGSRDVTVLTESFDKVVAGCKAGLPPADIDCLRSQLVSNGLGPNGSEEDEHVQAVLALLSDAEKRLASLSWPGDEEALAKGLKQSQKRLRKNWMEARKTGEPSALHDWRKRVKDQSAQLRLFRRVAPSAIRSRHGDEKETAELLGEEHDFWMLAERLSGDAVPVKAAATCELLLREIDRRRRTLRQQALKLGAGFSSQKPKAFAREMTAAWAKAAARVRARDRSEKAATSRAS
jgi:CHAD domain-containing protein